MMDFPTIFNARACEIGHGIRITGTEKHGGNLVCQLESDGAPLTQVGLTLAGGDRLRTLAVIAAMEQTAALCALTVFATAIDAAFGTQDGKLRPGINPRWRNGVLKRLHLFDGGFSTGQEMKTMSRGATFTVRIHRPARGLMQMMVTDIPDSNAPERVTVS